MLSVLTAVINISHARLLTRTLIMSTSKTVTHAFSGSKTSNIKAALEILKDVGKILEAVPYLEGVAGILKIIVDMKQVSTAMSSCKSIQCTYEGNFLGVHRE